MNVEENEFLKQENYYEGYQKKIDELRHNPDVLEFDKLCYFTFRSKEGKRLLDAVKERYLVPGFVNPNAPTANQAAMYFEGFKEAFRLLIMSVKAHEQRIEAEKNKQ